ncbi:MAG: hypothetical protein KC466_12485 [Myxococcales bacterium]|nr:hypothetical protein [Myxococcales bacterium]
MWRYEQTGAGLRKVFAWEDETDGQEATLVYVTSQGRRGDAHAAALVFSSDPTNAHFLRENSTKVTVRRLLKHEMAALLTHLEHHGLRSLSWSEQPYDSKIGPERALYLYEGGVRQQCVKDVLSDDGKTAFTDVEQELIALTLK